MTSEIARDRVQPVLAEIRQIRENMKSDLAATEDPDRQVDVRGADGSGSVHHRRHQAAGLTSGAACAAPPGGTERRIARLRRRRAFQEEAEATHGRRPTFVAAANCTTRPP